MWPQGLAIYLLLVIVRGGGEVVDKVEDKVENLKVDKVENLSRVEEGYFGKTSEQQLVGRRSRAVQHFEQPTTLQRMLAEARQ